MRLDTPKLTVEGDTVIHETDVAFSRGDIRTLRYSVPRLYEEMVSCRADAPLLAALIPAMRRGGDVRVTGTLTDEVYHTLAGEYQDLLRSFFTRLKPVNIRAEDVQPVAETAPKASITGFSGGIDSWQVLAEYFFNAEVPERLRITHLLYNKVGSHGRGGGDEVYQRRLKEVLRAAGVIGLPVIPVTSNMEVLYPKAKFSKTHTPRNASVAYLLGEGTRHFFYGSAYPRTKTKVSDTVPSDTIGMADPVGLPLLSTTNLALHSAGGSYNRVEKTLQVVKIPPTTRFLDICVRDQSDFTNCTECFKCRRTALTLEISGDLPRYHRVFDLDLWESIREQVWAWAKKSTDSPLEREVVEFAVSRGYSPRQTAGAADLFGSSV